MDLPRRLWLWPLLAMLAAACIVVVDSPTPTAAPIVPTSTRPPTVTAVYSPTPLTIVTGTPAAGTSVAIPIVSETPPSAAATALLPATGAAATATLDPARTAVPISITLFTISPAEIRPGQEITLTWEVAAEQVTIYRLDALGRLSEFYNVPLAGSLTLSTPGEQRGRADFALFASAGGAQAQAFVSARILCPDSWFFADPPPDCPASPPHHTVMQAEHFERGLMLWTQYDDRIYILYNDGASPRWDVQANAWFPGQPELDPSIVPPPGLYQPVRGFGVAWRTGYVSPNQVVRDRLGWATEPEFSVPAAAVQCDSSPRYSRCYLTGPGGVVFVLEPERSGWRVWP